MASTWTFSGGVVLASGGTVTGTGAVADELLADVAEARAGRARAVPTLQPDGIAFDPNDDETLHWLALDVAQRHGETVQTAYEPTTKFEDEFDPDVIY